MNKVTIGSYEVDATDYSTIGGASVGLVLWILAAYVFHGRVPDAVSGFVLIVVPALLARFASKLTRANTAVPGHIAEHAAGHPLPQPPPEGAGGPADGNVRIL